LSADKKSVFISHSSKDKQTAMLVRQALERNDIGYWISSRDIPPNADWAKEITKGLEAAELVVLILSENAVESEEVLKELTLASGMKMPVVTINIDNVKPKAGFKYHLAVKQWESTSNPPSDLELQVLVGKVAEGLLDAKRTWWRPKPETAWYKGGLNWILLPLVLVAAALGVFGVPYLLDRFGGDTAEQTGHLPDNRGAETLAMVERDTVTAPDISESADDRPPVTPPVTRGTVTLTSHPSGANVRLNGEAVGRTPLHDHEVEAGSYTARFSLAGYRTRTQGVVVRAGGGSVLDVTLTRELTVLDVTSIPSAANVVLDGNRIGTTPCSFDGLTGGTHVVAVSKDGYATRRDTIALRSDRPYTHDVRLESRVGQLTITVLPSGSISINGEPRAADSNTPYTTNLRPGTYEIEARHLIYGAWRKSVEVAHGDDKALVFDFSREYDVTVTSNPSNAAIYVNNRFRGFYTPYMIPLRPGTRRIDVKLDGYHSPGVRELTVDEDVDGHLHFDMQRTP